MIDLRRKEWYQKGSFWKNTLPQPSRCSDRPSSTYARYITTQSEGLWEPGGELSAPNQSKFQQPSGEAGLQGSAETFGLGPRGAQGMATPTFKRFRRIARYTFMGTTRFPKAALHRFINVHSF